MRDQNTRQRILWITRTGVLLALLIALQWITAGTQAFAGQYITGACVNCVLAVAALFGGLWSGVIVALLSPFCAFLLGIGPQLIQIVPVIVVGNLAFVICLYILVGSKKPGILRQAGGLLASAVVKFGLLYLGVVHLLIPVMGEALKEPQIKKFTAMFSWPQLVTALLGGTAALLILPLLKRAIKE